MIDYFNPQRSVLLDSFITCVIFILISTHTSFECDIYLIGMLLDSRSLIVEENAVEVFHHYGVHLSSSFLMENKNVVVLQFPLHIFMPLANSWFIHLQW